jgi:hypothetical protein
MGAGLRGWTVRHGSSSSQHLQFFSLGQAKKPRVGLSPDPQFWGISLWKLLREEGRKDQDSSGLKQYSPSAMWDCRLFPVHPPHHLSFYLQRDRIKSHPNHV